MKLRTPIFAACLVIAAMIYACNTVHAQQPTHILLSWLAPTPTTDYPASTVYTYMVLGGPKSGPYTPVVGASAVTGLQFTDGPLPLGEHCYVIKATAPDGKQSTNSNEACATILLVKGPVPSPNTPSATVVP